MLKRIWEYDIVILTETKCDKANGIYFAGYKTICKESKASSGGIAIIVKKDIELEIIKGWKNIDDSFDILGIRIINRCEKLNVIALL